MHCLLGIQLGAHHADGLFRGADIGKSCLLDRSGEGRLLRKETVSRVDSIGACHVCHL